MHYTIADLKDDLSGIGHGVSLDDVTNFEDMVYRAARNILSKVTIEETVRIQNLANPIHDEEYGAVAPTDLLGNRIIDLRPQVNRNLNQRLSQSFSLDFDLRKSIENNTFIVQNDSGQKSLRINEQVQSYREVIAPMNTTTEDGSWLLAGAASNLTTDSIYYVSGNASFKFSIGVGQNTIRNTTMSIKDLTLYNGVGTFFMNVYISDTSKITDLQLVWGDDVTTKYWTSALITAQSDGTAFRTGWNTLKFEWNGAVQTGTVDPTTIDSFKVIVDATGILTDFRLDNIVISLGYIWEIEYYSKYLFQSSAGVWMERPSGDDADIINLDTDSINLLVYECALLMAQQVQGGDSAYDSNWFTGELYGAGNKVGLYDEYKSKYPSRTIRPRSYYYRLDRYRPR